MNIGIVFLQRYYRCGNEVYIVVMKMMENQISTTKLQDVSKSCDFQHVELGGCRGHMGCQGPSTPLIKLDVEKHKHKKEAQGKVNAVSVLSERPSTLNFLSHSLNCLASTTCTLTSPPQEDINTLANPL